MKLNTVNNNTTEVNKMLHEYHDMKKKGMPKKKKKAPMKAPSKRKRQ